MVIGDKNAFKWWFIRQCIDPDLQRSYHSGIYFRPPSLFLNGQWILIYGDNDPI